jgi:mannan endo-1,4-beta-mannosidase
MQGRAACQGVPGPRVSGTARARRVKYAHETRGDDMQGPRLGDAIRAVIASATIALCSCDSSGAEPGPEDPIPDAGEDTGAMPSGRCVAVSDWGSDFVRIGPSGQFMLAGEPFVPQGMNSYPLLQHVGDGRLTAVEDILAQAVALGRPLIRTPAFIDGGAHPARIRGDDGALREQGLVALDRVLAAAAEQGVRLILILTNNWQDFGGAPAVLEMVAPGEGLPKNAFWSDPRAIEAQLGYQRALATRINSLNGRLYAEDPTIFAWELVNEARCERSMTPELCSDTTLVDWAKRMSDGLRAAGVQQLIAWGGAGYLDDYGEDLRAIGAEGGVDVLTLHMYASRVAASGALRAEAAIEAGETTLRERYATARALGKPLLLEEVNWKPAPDRDREAERATVLAAWLDLAAALQVGALPWMIGEQGRTDYDGYLIRPEDSMTNEVLECE